MRKTDLRIIFHPLPWTWLWVPYLYHDRGFGHFRWLFLDVELDWFSE